jgi:hypothetical protein
MRRSTGQEYTWYVETRMARRVLLLLCTGCLIPNPSWSGAGGTTSVATTGTDTTAESSSSGSSESGTSTGDDPPITPFCEPLPPMPGDAVIVPAGSTVAQINDAIATAGMGSTVALEPGTYEVGAQPIVIDRADVTLRSTTGDASDVILDGTDTAATLVRVRQSGVTLAGVTLTRSVEQGVLLGGDQNIARIALTHLDVVDALRRGVASIDDPTDGQYVDEIEIACSQFRTTQARRAAADCPGFFAISIDSSRDSVVRDNVFNDFYCDMFGTSTVTLRFDAGSRDTVIERNRFSNHFRGVIFGGEDPALVTVPARVYADDPCGGGYWGHIGGVIRNNQFWNGSDEILASAPGSDTRTDAMISFWTVCDGAAYHNTIISLMDPDETFSGIEWRWPTTTVEVVNNLVTDALVQREAAVLTVGAGNLELANPNEVIDPLGGDLHLAPTAQSRGGGVPLPAVTEDFEGDLRGEPPDVGADELVE